MDYVEITPTKQKETGIYTNNNNNKILDVLDLIMRMDVLIIECKAIYEYMKISEENRK